MPEAFAPTVAEREAELIALQNAFDEYIASSRELEEELDAELGKMQEKLSESTAANAALSSQLQNIGPQLTSLEQALTEARRKLKEEQRLRRAAEQGQDEADQRVREMEMALQTVREECDVVHEELAFKENELEETKLELEVEKQQLENELSKMRSQLKSAARSTSLMDGAASTGASEAESDMANTSKSHDTADSVPSVDDGYVRKLEEELELVTEQLIEMEKRLTETEQEGIVKDKMIQDLQDGTGGGRSEEDEDLIRTLQGENADRLESEEKLRAELTSTKEELALSKEELTLQQEELQAVEEDCKNLNLRLDEERVKHKEVVNQLSIQLREAEVASKSSLTEAARVASVVQGAGAENDSLKYELQAMEEALKMSKQDYQSVLEELEAVNARFDEARQEAAREGREIASQELRTLMKADSAHEVEQVKSELAKLVEENRILQQKVDDAEMAVASAQDASSSTNGASSSHSVATSAVAAKLQAQLTRAKEDLARKDKEIEALTSSMEERLEKAEADATRLEGELSATKGKLAESEAHLIVLRGEKERATKSSSSSSPAKKKNGKGSPSKVVDRKELARMEAGQKRGRARARSSSPSSVVRLTYSMQEEQKKYKALETEHAALQEQKRFADTRIKRLEDDLKLVHKQLYTNGADTAVTTQMTRLSALANKEGVAGDLISGEDDEVKRLEQVIQSNDSKLMATELKSLQKKCDNQRLYNSQLLSKMLHLQGNIQVYCRVRPMSNTELSKGARNVVESLSETEVGCFDSRSNKWKSFAFDKVWGPDQSQTSVFQDVEPLALSVVDGFNACIFAYGQTGSGKTFTMEGVAQGNQYGISYRTIQKIFHLLNLRAQQQRAAEMFVGSDDDEPAKEVEFTFELKIGMLEIYNDEIYDLLATSGSSMAEKKHEAMKAGGKASLDIRRDKDGRVEVPNLTKEKVDTIEEVMALLKRGNHNRATATTDMNEHSSRSHMVLMVDVMSGLEESQRNKGTLYLVDLAGSERVRKSKVEGDQLKEAGFINRSLSALGNVMEALDRKSSHVPFRDSKLTYMLQDSLGGNSRTMMIVTISPMDASYDESVHALQFATRVRRIQIGAAQRNVTSKNLEETVKSLTDEMRALTRAKERTEGQLHSLKRDNARVQDKLQNLSKARTQNRAESKTLEVLRKNNDDMAARWQKEKAAREEQSEELEAARKEVRSLQQQAGKAKSKIDLLQRKLTEKEEEHLMATKQLQQERTNKNAATVRARRTQVMARAPARTAASAPPKSSATGAAKTPARAPPTPKTPAAAASLETTWETPAAAASSAAGPTWETPPTGGAAVADETEGYDAETAEIREKVLRLLEKYDQAKVDRIDIIMEKFKGKEALLLEKMTQRYESGSVASAGNSVQKRNEMALQRHQERMKRIREKQNGGGK